MARPRHPDRANWPANLREPRAGYYTYRSPLTKREVSIGGDLTEAIRFAKRSNREAAELRADKRKARGDAVHGVRDERGLLEPDYIAAEAMLYDSVVGVYFLLQDDEVVYVGKSTDALRRLSQHRTEATKQFNRVYLIQCQPVELDRLELMYIAKFRPKYNGTAPAMPASAVVWRGTFSTALAQS